MEFWNIVMLVILGYVCVYGIVNRICKAIETVAMAQSYVKYVEAGGKLPFDELAKNGKS